MPGTDYDPKAVLEASSFSLKENEHKSAQQASITYMMRAGDGQALGNGGETLAFGKPKYDSSNYNSLESQKTALSETTRNLMGNSQDVKDWNALQTKISGLPNTIQVAQNELARTEASLAAVRLTGNEANIARWESNKAADQAVLDELNEFGQNLEQHQATLEGLAQRPDVLAYNEAKTQHDELFYQNKALTTIANASAPLFADKLNMNENPTLGGDRELLTRSVATYKVDQLLGTNVIAEEKLGVADDGMLLGVSVQADGAQVTGKHEEKDCYLQADYSDPRIQKGMADLEAMDYITGQIDRHNGNVFVDPSSGKVTGIDNDLAFPEVDREQMLAGEPELLQKAVMGMPKQMAQDTAQKILALSPERLGQELASLSNPDGSGKLSEASIDGAKQRLVNLQNAIKDPKSGLQVVAQFDDRTYAAAVKSQMDNVNVKAAENGLPPFQVSAGNDFSNVDDPGMLKDTPKASYLGSAVLQGQVYNIGMQEKPEEFAMREPDTVGKARVNPEFATYKKAEQNAIKSLAASPQMIENLEVRKQVTQLQKEMEPLKAKLADYQKQLDKLEHPTLAEKAKAAFTHKSVDGAKEYFTDKQAGVLQQLKAKEEALAAQLDKAVAPLRPEMQQLAAEGHRVEQPAPDIEVDNEALGQDDLRVSSEVGVNNPVPIEQQGEVAQKVDGELEVLKGEVQDQEEAVEVDAEMVGEEKESVEEVAVDQQQAVLQNEEQAEQKQEQKEEQKQEQPEPDINLEHHQKQGSVGQFMQAKPRSPNIQKLVEMGIKPPPLPPLPGGDQAPKQDQEGPAQKPNLRAQFQRQNANPAAIGEHRAQHLNK